LTSRQSDESPALFDDLQVESFQNTLEALEESRPFAKGVHRSRLLGQAMKLLHTDEGLAVLDREAPRFDAAGIFSEGDWDQPERLNPALVRETLLVGGANAAVECLSEMRLLAIAEGRSVHEAVSPADARSFLENVLALNLDLLFPQATEASRSQPVPMENRIRRLFGLMLERLGAHGILAVLAQQAERFMLQRPIMVQHVQAVLRAASRSLPAEPSELEDEDEQLARLYVDGLMGPTRLSRHHRDPADYGLQIEGLDPEALEREAHAFADSMRRTGLVAPQHAVLLRHLADRTPELVPEALWLNVPGYASFEEHRELVLQLVRFAVWPDTARCVYGLHGVLERGILFFRPVGPGLKRLTVLPIQEHVAETLKAASGLAEPPSANVLLLAGTLSVLGQPRGVDQGYNPTCQAARAISLWSQNDVGYLLELIAEAARDDEVVMHFEGDAVRSSELEFGLAQELHTELDPVSLLLTPHLDRIYMEMSRRTIGRGEDGHRWVNPEFHGWWVHRGFAAALHEPSGTVYRFGDFARMFFASYHPEFNGGRDLVYAQPCGIAVTDHNGDFVGWHAVSIQRVAPDPDGVWRVYFFNPNRDKEQDWGQGVVCSISDHDELEGEASLSFEQFASRLYVYHYDPAEEGDLEVVPWEYVAEVREAAAASWASGLEWRDDGDSETGTEA